MQTENNDSGLAQAKDILDRIMAGRQVWLHQSGAGMFVMFEDNAQNLYIQIWDSERDALNAPHDERTSVTSMDFNELMAWTRELESDGVDFAVSTESGALFGLPAHVLGKMIKPYVTAKFVDSDCDESDE